MTRDEATGQALRAGRSTRTNFVVYHDPQVGDYFALPCDELPAPAWQMVAWVPPEGPVYLARGNRIVWSSLERLEISCH